MRAFRILSMAMVLASCGGEETAPVAPAPIAPGTPSSAVPGVQPAAPGTPGTTPVAPVAPTTPVAPGTPPPAAGTSSVSLSAGFMPDPSTTTGTSGGPVAASTFDASCRGHVSAQPNHVLNWTTASPTNVRVVVNGGTADTTLVVQLPSGQYLCNDDSEGRHPMVAANFGTGAYRIWVGSYNAGQRVPYTIGISELASVTPGSLTAPPSPSGATVGPAPARAVVTLQAGFMPDPQLTSGSGGGPVNASTFGAGCVGHVAATPNHTLMVQGTIPNLRVVVNSGSLDTTLVIRRPDGTYACNDDGDGMNPVVSGAFGPGAYQVFVGSYNQGTTAPYRLAFSELNSVTALSVGTP